MNEALEIVEDWCNESGFKVNAEKSQLVRFTQKTKNINMEKIFLFGKDMPLSDTVKYLGIFLDSKLTMNRHFDEIQKKANKTLWAARSMVSKTWGLRPHMVL